MPTERQDKSTVHSVLRACRLIEALSSRGTPMSLAEAASITDLQRPTAHRLLATLEMAGWVRRTENRGYTISSKLFSIGAAAPEIANLRELGRPILVNLAADTGDTAYLLAPEDGRALCVDRVEGPHPVRVHAVNVGGSIPMTKGGAPLAILAFRPDLFDQLDPQSEDLDHVAGRLAEIVEQGFAMTADDMIKGVAALGAPVLDRAGRAIAAISVTGTKDRFAGAHLTSRTQLVKAAAEALTQAVRSGTIA